MKRWHLFAFGLGVYILALIATAPATLLDASLRDASDGRLRIAQARGSLWSGSGQLEIRDASGRAGLAKPLTWRLRPRALLRAQLAYELELDSVSKAFPVTIFWSRIELANADINLPAATLGYLVPKLAPLGLTGDLRIQISKLSLGRGNTQGSASLQWHAAGSALSPVSPLGDYQLRFEAMGPEHRASLNTLQGPLQLVGQGSWSNGSKPAFLATANMAPPFQQQLAPFLRLIAVERSDGSFEWRLK